MVLFLNTEACPTLGFSGPPFPSTQTWPREPSPEPPGPHPQGTERPLWGLPFAP